MPESVYTHVVAAVEKAAQSPESQEARDVVLAACEEWFTSHFRTAVLAQDTLPIANSVARRWRRKPIEKWAHIGQHGTEWVAVRRVYFLLFSLLWRLCLAPESLNALVFQQLLWDMDECRLAVHVYDHPQGPVPEFVARIAAQLRPSPENSGAVPGNGPVARLPESEANPK